MPILTQLDSFIHLGAVGTESRAPHLPTVHAAPEPVLGPIQFL